MELKEHIKEIQKALMEGRFKNEASVSTGVVQRILQALNWPVFDPQTVWEQYTVEGRRVDYALCHPKEKPVVFIEVKQVGQGEGADRQLFEYVFHEGVPMAVLTDGQEWHFYLPAERGRYQERRVYKLDLLERDIDESAKRLSRYLSYQSVCSGESLESARKDYKDVAREREVKINLPIAWRKLVEEQDSLLIEPIADKVESLCGYKPEPDLVASFLSEKLQSVSEQMVHQISLPRLETVKRTQTQQSRFISGAYGFVFHGHEYKARNARDVFIKVMEKLSAQDTTFCERFAARPRHGRRRRYVAHNREELYSNRPDLCRDYSHQLKAGWWVGTNYSRAQIRQILKMASEVAGLRFGTDLVVHLGD
jgi:hypothetical protein